MNEKNNEIEEVEIGLRKLISEDIEKISEEIYQIVETNLNERVSDYQLSNFDIIVDIDNTQNLAISLDIIYNPSSNRISKFKKIIDETLEISFKEVDELLKERYSK